MISGRRKVCEEFTKGGLDVFSYRFDTPLVSQNSRHQLPSFGNARPVLTLC
jgi:hypothetical protein